LVLKPKHISKIKEELFKFGIGNNPGLVINVDMDKKKQIFDKIIDPNLSLYERRSLMENFY